MGSGKTSKRWIKIITHLREERRYLNIVWGVACICALSWGMVPNDTTLSAKEHLTTAQANQSKTAAKNDNDRFIWDYSGPAGPDSWNLLEDSYSACGHNRKQSPLDIPPRQEIQNFPTIDPYGSINMTFEDTGRTWALSADEIRTVTVDGIVYQLKSVEFHTPSEHTVHGFSYPLEIQLYHESANGKQLAFAVFASKSKNAFSLGFDSVVTASNSSKNKQTIPISVGSFIPKSNRGWSYSGSKTTPPCQESVRWFVFADTVAFSGAQLAEFRKNYPNNARPIVQQSGWVFDVLNNPSMDLSH